MNAAIIILIYALAIAVASILFLAARLAEYVTAFRETATKLYNVTMDRDALAIQNTGLRARLEKVTTSKS